LRGPTSKEEGKGGEGREGDGKERAMSPTTIWRKFTPMARPGRRVPDNVPSELG